MRRKILSIAMAATAAIGAGATSSAYAQAANVTLYGALILDTEGIFNIKQDNTAPTPGSKNNLYRVSSDISRFGIRGTEALGPGLNAIFQVESALTIDASGGTLAGRDTFVGFQGGWGTFRAGFFFSPYYEIGTIFGNVPTFRTAIFHTTSVWGNNGYNGSNVQTGSFGQRISNSVRYDMPNLGGFTASGQIGVRDAGDVTTSGDINQARRHAYVITGSGQYANDALAIGAAYEEHKKLRDGTVTNPNMTDKGLTVTGSYNFGPIKVAAAYEWLKYTIPAGGDLKRNYWAISGTGSLWGGTYYLFYGKANDGTGSARCTTTAGGITSCPRIGAVTLGPDTGAQQWEITYTYPLSKRTSLWGGYTAIRNERNAGYNYGTNPVAGVCTGNLRNAQGVNTGCGDSSNLPGLAIGVAHFF